MVDKDRNALLLLLYEILDGEGYHLTPDYVTIKRELSNSQVTFTITGHQEEDIGGTYLVSLLRLPDGR